jgi:hypothetical protein
MKIIVIALLLLVIPITCIAYQNPIDHAEDTIRRNTNNAVDDTISKIRIEAHEAQKEMAKGVKDFIRWILGQLLEVITILAVGYLFSYLVPKSTGRMMLIVTGLCGLNQFLKLFI